MIYINHPMLNIAKTNLIKFTPKSTAHVPLDIYYKDYVIDEVKSTKSLGMHTENQMNWKSHAEQIPPKLSAACFSIRKLSLMLLMLIKRLSLQCIFSQFRHQKRK